METPSVDVDNIIDRLLEVRGSKPGQQVDLEEHEIRYLCSKARSIFIKQPILLELEAPIKVCQVIVCFSFLSCLGVLLLYPLPPIQCIQLDRYERGGQSRERRGIEGKLAKTSQEAFCKRSRDTCLRNKNLKY